MQLTRLFNQLTQRVGQGIGLAKVKKLTEALDGRVTVEGELGKGTKFNVELQKFEPTLGYCRLKRVFCVQILHPAPFLLLF